MAYKPLEVVSHSHPPKEDGRHIQVKRGDVSLLVNDKEAVQLALALLRNSTYRP